MWLLVILPCNQVMVLMVAPKREMPSLSDSHPSLNGERPLDLVGRRRSLMRWVTGSFVPPAPIGSVSRLVPVAGTEEIAAVSGASSIPNDEVFLDVGSSVIGIGVDRVVAI